MSVKTWRERTLAKSLLDRFVEDVSLTANLQAWGCGKCPPPPPPPVCSPVSRQLLLITNYYWLYNLNVAVDWRERSQYRRMSYYVLQPSLLGLKRRTRMHAWGNPPIVRWDPHHGWDDTHTHTHTHTHTNTHTHTHTQRWGLAGKKWRYLCISTYTLPPPPPPPHNWAAVVYKVSH